MTEIVGGIRARLIHDSLYNTVDSALRQLGWFDTDRRHQPVHFIAKPVPWNEEVTRNTLAMNFQANATETWEVGSNLTYDTIDVVFDLYAESDSLGVDLTNDIRDLLRGRLHVGPQRSSFKVYDYRQATPTQVGYAIVDDVRIERPATLSQRIWERNWFQILCTVHDSYSGD